MDKTGQLQQVLTDLHTNQLALAAAIEELAEWVGERGSVDVVEHVKGCLSSLDHHQKAITEGIARVAE